MKSKCPKSASPYKGCPLVFEHEDDAILEYVLLLAEEIRLANGISQPKDSSREARIIDKAACQISAYMNGRIHQQLFSS